MSFYTYNGVQIHINVGISRMKHKWAAGKTGNRMKINEFPYQSTNRISIKENKYIFFKKHSQPNKFQW